MPFISKDWRSPGELWVKTQEGWEKKKVLEHRKSLGNNEWEENRDPGNEHTTALSHNNKDEAVKRLDFRSAVRDVRRFNYICALLDLLIGQQNDCIIRMCSEVLLAMLEEVASHATTSQHNPRGFRQSSGSQLLGINTQQNIERILNMAAKMQIREPNPESQPKLLQLPEECIREIILRLSDTKILSRVLDTCEQMASIVGEQRV
ncbi:hypothetical protein NQ317_007813 [Molorchus minor]|uniref:F-box domain-containing protein n=1 Tax=Molorchus minor TaxID=1323400 RepID=A0ABQ9J901_9CUCU|nr:hypothetical protein NQ317_007813 [Molorchus minor]